MKMIKKNSLCPKLEVKQKLSTKQVDTKKSTEQSMIFVLKSIITFINIIILILEVCPKGKCGQFK